MENPQRHEEHPQRHEGVIEPPRHCAAVVLISKQDEQLQHRVDQIATEVEDLDDQHLEGGEESKCVCKAE